MNTFLKVFPLIKVDEQAHMVWGLVTSETPDSDDEICDYPAAKADIKRWSDEQLAKTTAAGQDPSLGNMRVMHQLQIGGKAVRIEYHDDAKQVWVGSEPANDDVWHLLKGGFLTGHSIGGSYAWKKPEGKFTRYAPVVSEISYVDKSANPDASFAYVKADGTTELRKFAKPGPEEEKILEKLKKSAIGNLTDEDIDRIAKVLRGSLEKKTRYLVPDGEHLPVSDESGNVSHRLMGAAWAALHGGYRGNKYSGPDKAKALARLISLYHSEGIPLPSEKAAAALEALTKELADVGIAEFDTHLAKISEAIGELAVQTERGDEPMNEEQIKKCAAALGISVEEFKKTYIDGGLLEKGKNALAALHGHLKKAVAHHEKMYKDHGKMAELHEQAGEMHKAMKEHMDNCMKAHAAAMDGQEADKVLKALIGEGASGEFVSIGKTADGVEVFKRAEKKDGKTVEVKADENGLIKSEDVEKMITAALEKQKKEFDEKLEKTVAPIGSAGVVRLALIGRDGKEIEKAANSNPAADPMPV